MTVAYTRATPQFVEDGACGKGTDSKAHVGPDVVYTCQREYSGTNGGGKSGNAQITPQNAGRGAPPGQQRPDTHSKYQRNKEGPID